MVDQATLARQKQANGLDEGAYKLAYALFQAIATQLPATEEKYVEYTAEIEETVDTTTTLGQGQSASEAKAAVNEAVCLDTLACTVSASAETGRLRRRLQSTLYTSFRMYLYPLTGGTAAVGESVGDMVQAAFDEEGIDGNVTNSVKTALAATIEVRVLSAEDATGVDVALTNTTAIEEAVNAAYCGGANCTTVTAKVFAPPPPPSPPPPPDNDDDDDDQLTIILASTLGSLFMCCVCIGVAAYIWYNPQRFYRVQAVSKDRYQLHSVLSVDSEGRNNRSSVEPSGVLGAVSRKPSMLPHMDSSWAGSSWAGQSWAGSAVDDAPAAIVAEPVRAYTAR